MANIPKVWNGTAFIELEAAATVAPAASTTVVGIVQLTDSTSSTSTTTAATPNSVKSAFDLAGTAIPKNTVTTAGDILYASGSATVARLGIGTANQVLGIAAGVPAWTTIGASGGILKYEEFTSSGSFVIPANASGSAIVVLEVQGGGAGGAGGDRANSGQVIYGKGGGPGGRYGVITALMSSFGTAGGTVTVTIGLGGIGGTGVVGGGTAYSNGGDGGKPGNSSFGSAVFFNEVTSGNRPTLYSDNKFKLSGGVTNNTSGTAAFSTEITLGGVNGRGGEPTSPGRGNDSDLTGAGGGGGGGVSAVAGIAGAPGGKRYGFINAHLVESGILTGNGGAGGTASGGAGGTASGAAGGGGGGHISGNGGAGGAGDIGCGGGGGGGATSAYSSGAGGAGGGSRIRVWVIG